MGYGHFYHRLWRLGVGAALLLGAAAAQAAAQTAAQAGAQTFPRPTVQTAFNAENGNRQPWVPRLRAVAPDLLSVALPFPQPLLPEASIHTMRLVIRLRERRVYVYRGEVLYTTYPIAVGRAGWETPMGNFQVMNMVENPGWRNPFNGGVIPPGPDNPLGDRWIGFWTDGTNQIGFHGTPNENSVGQAASHGCIRMYNDHVRQLFNLVAVGTPVRVEP